MSTAGTTEPGGMPSSAEQVGAAGTSGGTGKRTLLHRSALLALLIIPVVWVAARPINHHWHARRTSFYKTACQQAVEAKSWDDLDAVAAAWLKWDPNSNDAHVYRAEAAQQLGRLEEAVDELGRVSDGYRGALEALAIQADTLFSDLNRPYEAVETWQRMLRINPHADIARQRLIYFYAMTMQREKMLEEIYHAMELGCEPPEAYPYLLLAYDVTFSDGLLMTKQWLETYPDDVTLKVAHAVNLARYSPENTINIYGMSLISSGDETLVNKYLPLYPHNLELLAYRLDKAVMDGDEQRVLQLLSQCPAEAERDARFWRYRGWYLAAQDRISEAAEALETGLELHPYDWRSRLLLAGVLRQLDRPEEAAQAARVADFGHELHRELLQLPNARAAFNAGTESRIEDYLQICGDPLVLRAWKRRVQ